MFTRMASGASCFDWSLENEQSEQKSVDCFFVSLILGFFLCADLFPITIRENICATIQYGDFRESDIPAVNYFAYPTA